MNRSFFRGILAGSIIGTVIGMFSAPQMKPMPENVRKMMDDPGKIQNRAKKVLKGLSKGVSEIIK
ncbi:YtxH domain-containing protein [Candidatus Formimonas warabiya]|uniref:YtxH domain-containing protein n=1 Tax=Formimonas warabiya TaxID=1761012 RepID=A0A3G1KND0_FORW1|nr:YtxH domain-containing protein [Candidatus Formimonas warabiya]ATW23972.1 hypothetical protein DCMF_03465 [Candidatus Formimonas warabiya]